LNLNKLQNNARPISRGKLQIIGINKIKTK